MQAPEPIIYLVRHGQTEWNRQGIVQGQLDSPLTDLGREQAQAIGQYLADCLSDQLDAIRIESSHLGRALTTANIIRETLGLEKERLTTTPLLAEMHFGNWQGFDKAQIENHWPGQLDERSRNRWHFQMPNGENYPMLIARARQWLAQQRSAPLTIVVTHQQFSNALRGAYLDLTEEEILQSAHEQNCLFRLQHQRCEHQRCERICTQAAATQVD